MKSHVASSLLCIMTIASSLLSNASSSDIEFFDDEKSGNTYNNDINAFQRNANYDDNSHDDIEFNLPDLATDVTLPDGATVRLEGFKLAAGDKHSATLVNGT